ncbi:hypothetical protein ScPMuIL_014434 [Solemya velum]
MAKDTAKLIDNFDLESSSRLFWGEVSESLPRSQRPWGSRTCLPFAIEGLQMFDSHGAKPHVARSTSLARNRRAREGTTASTIVRQFCVPREADPAIQNRLIVCLGSTFCALCKNLSGTHLGKSKGSRLLVEPFLSLKTYNSNYPFLNGHHTSTLTPMHLRKAKLMFFYLRYPSSAILKAYFPDVKFNKNNTAQLVKWFSNFREFFYIQMEKYARQAIAEQTKHSEDIVVNNDSEIYRVLNLHYNRNNQIEVPDTFRIVVQSTLREFFKAVTNAKDNEPSWKKSIYKVIARMDDVLPEFFKSANWMDQLNDL